MGTDSEDGSCAAIRLLVESITSQLKGYSVRCLDPSVVEFSDSILQRPASSRGVRTRIHGENCLGHVWIISPDGSDLEEGVGYELLMLDRQTLFLTFRNRYFLHTIGVNRGTVGALLPLHAQAEFRADDLAGDLTRLLREHQENTHAKAC